MTTAAATAVPYRPSERFHSALIRSHPAMITQTPQRSLASSSRIQPDSRRSISRTRSHAFTGLSVQHLMALEYLGRIGGSPRLSENR